ncbi:MAG: hypothetical protein RL553_1723, partial [Planctomycetota bacterium]
ASSGQCQEKSDQIPLTGQQKADLERALTLNKQFGNLYSQGKYAEATPLAIENLKIRRKALAIITPVPPPATTLHGFIMLSPNTPRMDEGVGTKFLLNK